jgi:hypothetical protein
VFHIPPKSKPPHHFNMTRRFYNPSSGYFVSLSQESNLCVGPVSSQPSRLAEPSHFYYSATY